jgi:hypothetical protein
VVAIAGDLEVSNSPTPLTRCLSVLSQQVGACCLPPCKAAPTRVDGGQSVVYLSRLRGAAHVTTRTFRWPHFGSDSGRQVICGRSWLRQAAICCHFCYATFSAFVPLRCPSTDVHVAPPCVAQSHVPLRGGPWSCYTTVPVAWLLAHDPVPCAIVNAPLFWGRYCFARV